MAVYKRGHIWWYDFRFNGQRFRGSAKTAQKATARRVERDRRRKVRAQGVIVDLELNRDETAFLLKAMERSEGRKVAEPNSSILRSLLFKLRAATAQFPTGADDSAPQ